MGEPVGSKYLTRYEELAFSSATIRNEMAELEEMGYLEQPHTSAGRVPSQLGYRFYVDQLMQQYRMTSAELGELDKLMKLKAGEVDRILDRATKLMSTLTNYTGVALKRSQQQPTIARFDIMYLSARSFILVMLTLFVVLNLTRSRAGRAIMAIRDNRIAAQAIGLNLTKYKLMAFVTSAALAGAAGALYGLNYSSLQATKFNFNLSILVLVFVVLGGLGNIWGSLIAAAALTILPEALRQFADFRMLIYAIVLIFVMLATNNPQAKAFFQKLLPHHRASAEKED